VDQRHERLDVTVTERLEGGADLINAHMNTIPPSEIRATV